MSGSTNRWTAFVIMPFDESLEWLFEDVLMPVLTDADFSVRRADTELHQRNILKDIVNGIVDSDLIIADLSGLNANVMYELGIAHGLQKRTIMLTQRLDEAPFDLKAYRIHSYTPGFRDVNRLIGDLRELLDGFSRGSIAFGNPVTDFAGEPTLDQVSPPTTSEAPESAVVEIDMGILDFQEKIESSSNQITNWTEEVTMLMRDFSSDILSRSEALKAVEGDDSTAFKKRRAIVSSASQVINNWADNLEKTLPSATSAWEGLESTTDGFLLSLRITNDEELNQAKTLLAQMSVFLDQISEAQASVEQAKESTRSTHNISRDLTQASRRAERTLQQVAESMELGKSYATRVISVVRDRLEDYSGQEEDI